MAGLAEGCCAGWSGGAGAKGLDHMITNAVGHFGHEWLEGERCGAVVWVRLNADHDGCLRKVRRELEAVGSVDDEVFAGIGRATLVAREAVEVISSTGIGEAAGRDWDSVDDRPPFVGPAVRELGEVEPLCER